MKSGKIYRVHKILPVTLSISYLVLFPFVINSFDSFPMLVIFPSLYISMIYGTKAALAAGFSSGVINILFLILFKNNVDVSVLTSMSMGSLANLFFCYFAARVVRLNRKLRMVDKANKALISKLKKEKEKILRQNEAKSAFLANLSHEVRTPLAIVSNLLEQMKTRSGTKEDFLLDNALQQNSVLINILDDIMNAVRIERDDVIVEAVPFSLSVLIRRIENEFIQRAKKKQIGFSADFENTLPDRVLGDDKILILTLKHLLDNAIKFTDKGRVHIAVSGKEAEQDQLLLSFHISDMGPGIAEKDRNHIFEFYTQSDSSYSKLYQGTGMGLPLCRHYARMCGGDLIIEKTGDEGSVFLLTLSVGIIAENPGTLAHPVNRTEYRGVHCRELPVLIVEDHELLSQGLEQNLKQFGCRVLSISSGSKFEETLRNFRPELIFMDIQMPGRSGLDLIRILRKMESPLCSISVVAFSAYVTASEKNLFFKEGIIDFLGKPYRREDLEEILIRIYPQFCNDEEEKVEVKKIDMNDDIDETQRMIQELFIKDMPEKIDQLKVMVGNQNLNGTSKIIHSCINNLAAVRQEDLCTRGRRMEALARENELSSDSEDWESWLSDVSEIIVSIRGKLSS